ncbi:MAG TPA: polyhydroxyalkanoate depolymerase [Caulobacteraceae bacterium]|jgi:polyhydroxyalkanoate depolymerase
MIYAAYQAYQDATAPARFWAGATLSYLKRFDPEGRFWPALPLAAWLDLVEGMTLSHEHPRWGIDSVEIRGREVPIAREAVAETPFGSLLHFRKPIDMGQPKVLLVAPISGHFATLLRPTIAQLLPEHDVYVTDWANARDVPAHAGRFGLDEHIDHLLQFLRATGPGTHLFAVCQPCPSAIAATAILAQDGDEAVPASLVLMAGPVDARANPTSVSEFAVNHSLDWFERTMISPVPLGEPGYRRRVYPGFLQIGAFMSMNLERHLSAHREVYRALSRGESERAQPIQTFYDEYYAVSDLTAELFLETVDRVFQRRLLAKGEFAWRGRRVDPAAVTNVPLMTIEGERDDICSPGQTAAAHGLLVNVPESMKLAHVQAGAGHYGVFSGSKWRNGIYPKLREFIAKADRGQGAQRKAA